MVSFIKNWLRPSYGRRAPLILINGLAEQPETWYCNADAWRKHFDVHMPNLLTYEGESLHQRIASGEPISIDYLVERLHTYLSSFVQAPPYNLLANSMGGKVAVEFAARYPELVKRLVLLCPSGLADEERLPIVEGVRRNNMRSVVESVFYLPIKADRSILKYYESKVHNKRWRTGLLRAIRGTMGHSVRDRLRDIKQPTLVVVGEDDRIVDPQQTIESACQLANGELVVLSRCGHAPQIEYASKINRLVVDFLKD